MVNSRPKNFIIFGLIGIFVFSLFSETFYAQRNGRVSNATRINRLIEKGDGEIGNADYAAAIKTFDQCIGLKPRFIQAFECHLGRGVSLLQTGQAEKALTDFTLAEKKKPGDKTLRFFRGRAHFELGDFEKALKDFNFVEVLSTEKEVLAKFPGVYADRGMTFYFLGEFKDALTDIDKALEINPASAYLYVSRSLIFIKMKKYADARRDLAKALALDSSVKSTVGEIYLQIEKAEKSEIKSDNSESPDEF